MKRGKRRKEEEREGKRGKEKEREGKRRKEKEREGKRRKERENLGNEEGKGGLGLRRRGICDPHVAQMGRRRILSLSFLWFW